MAPSPRGGNQAFLKKKFYRRPNSWLTAGHPEVRGTPEVEIKVFEKKIGQEAIQGAAKTPDLIRMIIIFHNMTNK